MRLLLPWLFSLPRTCRKISAMQPRLPLLHHELPYLADSQHYFEKIRHLPWPVLLDSAQTKQGEDSRYDIAVADPFITLTTVGENTLITQNDTSQLSHDDPFLLLDNLLKRYPVSQQSDLPFCGGAVGYFGYDLGRRIEPLPTHSIDAEKIPDMMFGLYDWAIITDHVLQRCFLVSYGLTTKTQQQWQALVSALSNPSPSPSASSFRVSGPLKENFDAERYTQAFNKIQHYIREGDCYQVNLAKRFATPASGDPWLVYQHLRQRNAAPYSCFFSSPYVSILSSSPERLLKVKNKQIETKPIKGTRPRDLTDPQRDRDLAEELLHSPKDRAENIMIVDLLRNDLGKVCQPGSIQVLRPLALESFATVHHLVSTITGTLADDQHAVSLMRACFPGGSITGAPKLRAMEIIEELEPHRRGIYCGSVAYIGFDGNMDSNITIRTLVYSHHTLRFWAGGGIVADSQADAEYQEIQDKAAAMIDVITHFSG